MFTCICIITTLQHSHAADVVSDILSLAFGSCLYILYNTAADVVNGTNAYFRYSNIQAKNNNISVTMAIITITLAIISIIINNMTVMIIIIRTITIIIIAMITILIVIIMMQHNVR